MKGRAVKEDYEGRRFTKEASSFYGIFIFLWGLSWICREGS
jgi:hypothetical protein